MTKSKKTSKIWLQNETKNNNTSSKMLLDHCYAFGFFLKPSGLQKKFFEEGDHRDLFLPRPGSAPCKGPWVLHPHQVSSKSIKQFWRRSWKCKLSNGRLTDRRQTTTDDGQRMITIAHWSLRLMCPKKCS